MVKTEDGTVGRYDCGSRRGVQFAVGGRLRDQSSKCSSGPVTSLPRQTACLIDRDVERGSERVGSGLACTGHRPPGTQARGRDQGRAPAVSNDSVCCKSLDGLWLMWLLLLLMCVVDVETKILKYDE